MVFSVCLYRARRTPVLSVRCGLSYAAVVGGAIAVCGVIREVGEILYGARQFSNSFLSLYLHIYLCVQ